MNAPDVDRRRLPRVAGDPWQEIVFRLESDSALQPAIVNNRSIHGAGITFHQYVAPGTPITIYVQNTNHVGIDAQVKHSIQIGEDLWMLGCEFARFLAVGDL
jgi:hypothetical protein